MNYVHKLLMSFICTHIINNIYFFFDDFGLDNPGVLTCPFGFVVLVVVEVVVVVVVVVAVVDTGNCPWSISSMTLFICSLLRPFSLFFFTPDPCPSSACLLASEVSGSLVGSFKEAPVG